MESELLGIFDFIRENLERIQAGNNISTVHLKKCRRLIDVFYNDKEPQTSSVCNYSCTTSSPHTRVEKSIEKIVEMLMKTCSECRDRDRLEKKCKERTVKNVYNILDAIKATDGIYGIERIIAFLLGTPERLIPTAFRRHRLFAIGRHTPRPVWQSIVGTLLDTNILVIKTHNRTPRLSPEAELWFEDHYQRKKHLIPTKKNITLDWINNDGGTENLPAGKRSRNFDSTFTPQRDCSIIDDGIFELENFDYDSLLKTTRQRIITRFMSTKNCQNCVGDKYIDCGSSESNDKDDESVASKLVPSNETEHANEKLQTRVVCLKEEINEEEKKRSCGENDNSNMKISEDDQKEVFKCLQNILDTLEQYFSTNSETSVLEVVDIDKVQCDTAKVDESCSEMEAVEDGNLVEVCRKRKELQSESESLIKKIKSDDQN